MISTMAMWMNKNVKLVTDPLENCFSLVQIFSHHTKRMGSWRWGLRWWDRRKTGRKCYKDTHTEAKKNQLAAVEKSSVARNRKKNIHKYFHVTVNIKDDSRERQNEMKMVNKTSEITRKTGNMQTVSQLASQPPTGHVWG